MCIAPAFSPTPHLADEENWGQKLRGWLYAFVSFPTTNRETRNALCPSLEARSSRSRCQRGCLALEALSESHALPLPSSVLASNTWYSLVYRCITPDSSSVFTWCYSACTCECLCLFSVSFKGTSHIELRAHGSSVQPHLNQ